MSVNTCLIYRCLSSASAVIRSWFIYELQKSTTIAFSRNSLYTFYSRNPTCGIPPCLRISNRKYPPCPQNSIIVNPPSPSEILEAVRGMVWIFSGIAHYLVSWGNMYNTDHTLWVTSKKTTLLIIPAQCSDRTIFVFFWSTDKLHNKHSGNY